MIVVQCRFFQAEHTYSQDECEREFCYSILEHPRRRYPPLPLEPDPLKCVHEFETVYAKFVVPGSHRVMGGRHIITADGHVCTTERLFAVCLHCGMVQYSHEQLGILICYPVKR